MAKKAFNLAWRYLCLDNICWYSEYKPLVAPAFLLPADSVPRYLGHGSLGDKNSRDWTHLIHWGRVTHICVDKLTNNGSDNGLSPGWRQAINWTNAGILLIGHLGTIFSKILIEIYTFSFKKMHLKMSSAKRRPFCLGLNVLTPEQSGRHLKGMRCFKTKCLNYITYPLCTKHDRNMTGFANIYHINNVLIAKFNENCAICMIYFILLIVQLLDFNGLYTAREYKHYTFF